MNRRIEELWRILPLVTVVAWSPLGAQVIRVPQDVASFQAALDRGRTEGGTIELAAGTYVAPVGGFRLRNFQQPLRIRAAAGAGVELVGAGPESILAVTQSSPSLSHRVTLEGLHFRDASTAQTQTGGALTLANVVASLVECGFEGNHAETGGGVLVTGSDVVFLDSSWTGNSARVRGGALTIESSTVEIHRGRFVGNRTNLDGHDSHAVGGAVYVLDSAVRVVESHFEANEAAWVGGALYAIGVWREPLAIPATEVQVIDSVFVGNRVGNAPCCAVPGITAGGALHVEDHATLRLHRSELSENRAEAGGAINSYRAVVEIVDSILERNDTAPHTQAATFGGAIFIADSDFADSSTNFGAINRRTSSMLVEGTLVRGTSERATSQNGGCLAAVGDTNRRFGDGGVDADGGVAANRARVIVRNSVFADCLVEADGVGGTGFGGALNVRLTDLSILDSLILDSRCLGDECGGGGAAVSSESLLRLEGAVLAGNAAHRGGGVFLAGSTIEARHSRFIANRILTPGGDSNIIVSRGAGLFAIPGLGGDPARNTDVDGIVEDCELADNVGVPLFDVDTDSPPHNNVRYDRNRFGPTGFGSKVYVNRLVRASGETAPELNALVVQRADGTSIDKSSGGNVSLGSAPTFGALVVAPRTLTRPWEDQGQRAFVGFAWSGSTASLGQEALTQRSGVRELTASGPVELRRGTTVLDVAMLDTFSCSTGPLLCLGDGRFTLGVGWETVGGDFGAGVATELTRDTGYLHFFDPANVEMVVKVLDGCVINGRYWVFAGGLTNVATQMRVVDRATGEVRTYRNPQGTAFRPVQDTSAFSGCGSSAVGSESGASPEGGQPVLTLADGRFEVAVTWATGTASGAGEAVALTRDTGYFHFFDPANVEMVIKVLDGCGVNQRYWVFAGGLTNVEVEIEVRDTAAGESKTYLNPPNTAFVPIQDVVAFATCP